MKNSIIAVTEPDDILTDDKRLLLVDLTETQIQIVSQALNKIKEFDTIITYIWRTGNNIDWLLDKKHKSDLIIFNAESNDHIIVGYMSAQVNSYYVGTLKSLNKVNTRSILSVEQAVEILENSLT